MTSVNQNPQKWPSLGILPTSRKLIAHWGKGDAGIGKKKNRRGEAHLDLLLRIRVSGRVGALCLFAQVLFACTSLGIPCSVPKSGFREHWTWCLLKG